MFVVNPVMPCAWCPILHQTLICALIYQIKSNGYFVSLIFILALAWISSFKLITSRA